MQYKVIGFHVHVKDLGLIDVNIEPVGCSGRACNRE